MTYKTSIETRWVAPSSSLALELAAAWFKRHTLATYKRQGFVNWALSGGKTPKALYTALAGMDDLPWRAIRLFLVDERDVNREEEQSNLGMVLQTGLEKRLRSDQIFAMRKGPFQEKEQAANPGLVDHDIDYAALIEKYCPQGAFDLVLLGMGSDGHTASLFPGTRAAEELDTQTLVVTHAVPFLGGARRRSLSFESLLRARHLLFYLLGQDKAPLLDRVWNDPESSLPTALLRRWRLERHQAVDWVVDSAACGVAIQ